MRVIPWYIKKHGMSEFQMSKTDPRRDGKLKQTKGEKLGEGIQMVI